MMKTTQAFSPRAIRTSESNILKGTTLRLEKFGGFSINRVQIDLPHSKGINSIVFRISNKNKFKYIKVNSAVKAMASMNASNGKIEEKDQIEEIGGTALFTKNDENREYTLAVLGDLHLEPKQMPLFYETQAQVVQHLTGENDEILKTARVFQLGDVGGYKHNPGSWECFQTAVDYLDGFRATRFSVTGNHDLEGYEFATDAENLDAWRKMFGHNHYWATEVGGVVCIGLSTIQFRDALDSNHEVVIDDAQVEWFRETLKKYQNRPVFVFSHASPMGSGLTCLQNVHVRNCCAWLNHRGSAHQFIEIVQNNPQIKLWFSGHFHLSHDYESSLSVVGNCMFVQTGVMGECNRDGRRHSRIVKGNDDGYSLYTLDHASGNLRLDAQCNYLSEDSLKIVEVGKSIASYLNWCPHGGPLSPCVPQVIPKYESNEEMKEDIKYDGYYVKWIQIGDAILAIHANQIVQYDSKTKAPVGLVCDLLNKRKIRLVTSGKGERVQLDAIELSPTEASIKSSVEGDVARKFELIEKDSSGRLWKVFQINKWLLKLKERMDAAAAAALTT